MPQSKTYVIIGGVAGGASAAARLRRLDEQAAIIMLDRGPYVSFANCGLPYHIAGDIAERDKLLVMTPERFEQRLAVDVRTRSEVTAIDPAAQTVSVTPAEGEPYTLHYDSLVLSPGAAPVRPPLPGIDDPRIHALRTIPDMDRILDRIDSAQASRAVVVGGGYIGLEMTEALRQRDLKVSLIELLPQVMAPADPEMVQPLHQELVAHGVDLRLETAVTGFAARGERVAVELGENAAIEADLVVLAIGVKPEVELARAAGLTIGERGGIVVDAQMRTSDPAIWAVGDAVEVEDLITGTPGVVPLAGPANRQGRIAADVICGRESSYRGTQGTAICRVFSQAIAMTGLSEKAAHRAGIACDKVYVHPLDHAGYYPGASQLSLKLLYASGDGRLLGAQAVGHAGVDKRIDVLAVAMRAGMTVYDLEHLELCYAPPFGSAKDPVNYAGFVAANALRGDVALYDPAAIDALGDDQVLLNVATEAELPLISLPGQLHVPLDNLRQQLDQLPRDKELVTFCASGLRSYLACRTLTQQGFRCRNLNGGMKAVRMHREPVPATPPASPAAASAPRSGAGATASTQPDDALQVDATGLQCPGPVLRLKQAVDQAATGQVIDIRATDPAFGQDIHAWCHSTGHELLDSEREGNVHRARIRKTDPEVDGAAMELRCDGRKALTIVVFSNDYDRVIAAFIIANGAATMGYRVTLFFTFWGITALRRDRPAQVRKTLMERMFGFMLPRGARKLALSQMHMLGMGKAMINGIMKQKGVEPLPGLIASATDAGVKLVVCTMSMDLMGFKREELLDEVEEGGVATYLDRAGEAGVNLFI